ncbi:multicopper oxidase family protein [Peribacillus kribbensis]|uniref:multicopper oxidase family protein n=1 Tax=Peribacillus kribbensis TaxID=356658 RepID=UPI00041459AA|nr:multicopper oxidase [Peribacillus kribbensis]
MDLEKFADALPVPPVLKAKGLRGGIPYYKVTMKQAKQKLHRDLPPATVWGYNGMYPGPTFEVRRNQPILVKWKNKLPAEHFLPVDQSVHGAGPDQPAVRTVVHLHEGRVAPESDGYPEAWFTKDFARVGPRFVQKYTYYPNCQRPAALWYHDHAIGITRLNVYAGLAGFYILRDEEEEALQLPSGEFEIPLLIQDRAFYPNGELFYPIQPGHQPPPAPQPEMPIHPALPNPSVVPEFFGTAILVNGKVWPYLEVEPRKYRFRILNGSNGRFYGIALSSGQPFIQIGTDGGLLEKPTSLPHFILAPAERIDVIIDFSNHIGQNIVLTNDAKAPFPNGHDPSANLRNIMQFRVLSNLSAPDQGRIPDTLSCLEQLHPSHAVTVRKSTLVETKDTYGRPKLLLDHLEWDHPLTETPSNGATEIWELYNPTRDTHPIHLHLVTFQILNRASFTGDPKSSALKVGLPKPPDPSERGWKDTVCANPGEVTRIIARFGPYPGIYPWHCHILEHEDHEMMRPFKVLDHPNFHPCQPFPGECPDDSFSQCFGCHKNK